MNFAIVEAHHDFCLHDQVPHRVEVGFHDLEEVCALQCAVGRLKDPDHQVCPDMACPSTDAEVEAAINTLSTNGCDTDCPEADCGVAFRTLKYIHDKCEAADDKFWEWAGVFSVADSSHTWSMQKVDGAYADPSMRLVLIPTDMPNQTSMVALENLGSNLLAGSCMIIEVGESMTPAADGSCFELHVGTGDDSTFTIVTDGISGLAVYAQHVPIEFERDRHYLYDSSEVDIEPVAEESGGGHAGHDHGHRRLAGHRRLVDVDAALHTYEDACDAVNCYIESPGCANSVDFYKLTLLEKRASKKCHVTLEEATACPVVTPCAKEEKEDIPTCGCLAEELDFEIDCTATVVIEAAYDAVVSDC